MEKDRKYDVIFQYIGTNHFQEGIDVYKKDLFNISKNVYTLKVYYNSPSFFVIDGVHYITANIELWIKDLFNKEYRIYTFTYNDTKPIMASIIIDGVLDFDRNRSLGVLS